MRATATGALGLSHPLRGSPAGAASHFGPTAAAAGAVADVADVCRARAVTMAKRAAPALGLKLEATPAKPGTRSRGSPAGWPARGRPTAAGVRDAALPASAPTSTDGQGASAPFAPVDGGLIPRSSRSGAAAAPDPTIRPSRVLVTRPVDQAEETCRLLRRAGMEPVCYPTIAVQPAADLSALDTALADLAAYDYAVFPSSNAAHVVGDRLQALGIAPGQVATGLTVVAGPATARVLAECGLPPSIVLHRFSAAAALKALAGALLTGKRVLLPRAEDGRADLTAGLRALGARVDEVVAYQTVAVTEQTDLAHAVAGGEIDAVTLFSPSAAAGLATALAAAGLDPQAALRGVAVACIGRTTAAAVRTHGWQVDILPEETTTQALVTALAAFLARPGSPGRAAPLQVAAPAGMGAGVPRVPPREAPLQDTPTTVLQGHASCRACEASVPRVQEQWQKQPVTRWRRDPRSARNDSPAPPTWTHFDHSIGRLPAETAR